MQLHEDHGEDEIQRLLSGIETFKSSNSSSVHFREDLRKLMCASRASVTIHFHYLYITNFQVSTKKNHGCCASKIFLDSTSCTNYFCKKTVGILNFLAAI